MKEYLIHARGVYNSDAQQIEQGMSVQVQGEKIARIAPFEVLRADAPDIPCLDYRDCYLLPGIINTHVHLEFNATASARLDFIEGTDGTHLLLAAHNAQSMLGSGVTMLRDAGSSWGLLDIRHEQSRKLVSMPRMQLSGPPITVTGGHLHFMGEETDSIEDMVRQVRIRQKRGCDAVKLIVTGGQMTPGSMPERVSLKTKEIMAMVEEARLLNLPTFAHCLTTEGFVRCMDGGVDSIEHVACFVRNRSNQLLERVYETERMEGYRNQSRYMMMGLSAGYHNLDRFRSGEQICGYKEAFWLEQEERMFEIFKKCIDLGLTPVCGTDAGTSGTFFDESWLEIALMVERGGLTAAQAIEAGTRSAAACLNLQGITGSLKEGMSADIIALKENPLENIRALGNVQHVICCGEVFENNGGI